MTEGQTSKIKVYLIEDHSLIRESLRQGNRVLMAI